jgi:hypothetical protein
MTARVLKAGAHRYIKAQTRSEATLAPACSAFGGALPIG